MSAIHLLAVGEADAALLDNLRADLARTLGVRCRLLPGSLDPASALHPERRQVHSTEILARLEPLAAAGAWRVLGVTAADLYIPVLTFVFGEAQMGGPAALASYHRLRQEFYGLPADAALLRQRLLKEAVHELGHTFGLAHCEDYRCVMAPAHAVEWVDVKGAGFCDACRLRVMAASGG